MTRCPHWLIVGLFAVLCPVAAFAQQPVNVANTPSVNQALVGGSTVATAATGIQKVGVVGNAGGAVDGATGASVPENALQDGWRGATAYPTAVSDGQLVAPMTDKAGRPAVVLNSVRDLVGAATGNIDSSSATSLISAGGSGVFDDLVSIIFTNSTATGTSVTITDNGSGGNSYTFDLAANGGMVATFPTPLPQGTANAAWDISCSPAETVHYTIVYVKNK